MDLPPPSSPPPPEATCASCSKPIHPAGSIKPEPAEFFHIRCRSRQLHVAAIEHRDRSRLAIELAESLALENARLRRRAPMRLIPTHDPCPVCGVTATLTDWRPDMEWMAVEGCPC